MTRRLFHPVQIFVFLAMCVLLVGCKTGPTDPRETFAIGVSEETVTLPLNIQPAGELLSPADRSGFERFVADYHMRGRQPVTVRLPAGDEVAARVRRALIGAGIRAREITVVSSAQAGGAAVLSYVASVAKVPDCGHWGSGSSLNWTNRSQSNYGCATQRNLGLTVANPEDLRKSDPMNSMDGTSGAVIIRSKRAGAAAGIGDGAAAGAAK